LGSTLLLHAGTLYLEAAALALDSVQITTLDH
jgi:hypothetical protein